MENKHGEKRGKTERQEKMLGLRATKGKLLQQFITPDKTVHYFPSYPTGTVN